MSAKKIIWLGSIAFLIFINPIFGIMAWADEYWISYSAPLRTQLDHPPGGPKYLIKIDALGNVLIPATKVVTNSNVYVSPQLPGTAINHRNDRTINMWFTSRGFIGSSGYPVFRAVIDKNTMRLLSIRKTSVARPYTAPVQVTQTGVNDFLALDFRINEPPFLLGFAGYRLTDEGALTTESFPLFQGANNCEGCGSSVSSDGRAFVFTRYSIDRFSKFTVIYQRLSESGRPVGKAVIVVDKSPRLGLMDVSDSLSEGRRYILYTFQSLGPNSIILYLQPIDNGTGKKIGDRIRIASDLEFTQSAAVDPLGRFVIYATYGTRDRGALMYQALDAIGSPSGAPKILATDVSSGIDILKD